MEKEFAEILICDCNSIEHQIVINYDEEDNISYLHVHLIKRGFFRRLKSGLMFIFGYKCRYGNFDEFIFKKEHADKLRELADLLEKNK